MGIKIHRTKDQIIVETSTNNTTIKTKIVKYSPENLKNYDYLVKTFLEKNEKKIVKNAFLCTENEYNQNILLGRKIQRLYKKYKDTEDDEDLFIIPYYINEYIRVVLLNKIKGGDFIIKDKLELRDICRNNNLEGTDETRMEYGALINDDLRSRTIIVPLRRV